MKAAQPVQKTLPEERLAFERQRLLNLIDSSVKRSELESAKGFAEELFKREIQFALFKRTRLLRRCNAALLNIIVALLGIFFVCTASTVLNIRPSFNLVAEGVVVLGIISVFVVDSFLVKRLEKAVKMIMDVYDNRRQIFVESVLAEGAEYIDPEVWLRVYVPTMIK